VIRSRDRLIGIGDPILRQYERICFEKQLIAVPGKPLAAFVCPGHPLLDAIDRMKDKSEKSKEILAPQPIIAMLPGSREQEIKTMLPVMLEAIRDISGYSFVIAGAPSQPESIYRNIIGSDNQVKLLFGQTYTLLQQSHAALVTSGTATLETALFGVPLVVCYKGNYLSYQIARRLVKVKYISLVNLVMDREVVKELIQDQMSPNKINEELRKILQGDTRDKMKSELEELKKKLGGKGASKKAALLIFNYLNKPAEVTN
jgi:lipid-A-disaccharide synthase